MGYWATRVRVVGPLAAHAEGLRTVLAERGYAPSPAAGQLQLMAHPSRPGPFNSAELRTYILIHLVEDTAVTGMPPWADVFLND
jgi:hypothetical protein